MPSGYVGQNVMRNAVHHPQGGYPYMIPVHGASGHPMYYPYAGQSMSPVGHQVGMMPSKADSPTVPTGSQHTPGVKGSAARCLSTSFSAGHSSRVEEETPINYANLRNAFQSAGVDMHETKRDIPPNESYKMKNTAMADIVSRVRAAGGKVTENPLDKSLSIHFDESVGGVSPDRNQSAQNHSHQSASKPTCVSDKVVKVLEDGTVVTVITTKPDATTNGNNSRSKDSITVGNGGRAEISK